MQGLFHGIERVDLAGKHTEFEKLVECFRERRLQIVLYIGGIMVLFLFVIMLVNLDAAARERQYHRHWIAGARRKGLAARIHRINVCRAIPSIRAAFVMLPPAASSIPRRYDRSKPSMSASFATLNLSSTDNFGSMIMPQPTAFLMRPPASTPDARSDGNAAATLYTVPFTVAAAASIRAIAYATDMIASDSALANIT